MLSILYTFEGYANIVQLYRVVDSTNFVDFPPSNYDTLLIPTDLPSHYNTSTGRKNIYGKIVLIPEKIGASISTLWIPASKMPCRVEY